MIRYNHKNSINWVTFADLDHGDTFLYDDEPYICAMDDFDFKRGVNLLCGWIEDFSDTTPVKRVEFEIKEV